MPFSLTGVTVDYADWSFISHVTLVKEAWISTKMACMKTTEKKAFWSKNEEARMIMLLSNLLGVSERDQGLWKEEIDSVEQTAISEVLLHAPVDNIL